MKSEMPSVLLLYQLVMGCPAVAAEMGAGAGAGGGGGGEPGAFG